MKNSGDGKRAHSHLLHWALFVHTSDTLALLGCKVEELSSLTVRHRSVGLNYGLNSRIIYPSKKRTSPKREAMEAMSHDPKTSSKNSTTF